MESTFLKSVTTLTDMIHSKTSSIKTVQFLDKVHETLLISGFVDNNLSSLNL
jgi:hypothetical protein